MYIRERKTRYDGSVAEYPCRLVRRREHEVVLLYRIPDSFQMEAGERHVHIPSGTLTVAYYWNNRPYNVYHWRSPEGTYLGSYFNIVRHTQFGEREVSYTDMIVDVYAFPDGRYVILDEDELPEPLPAFEGGAVYRAVQQLIGEMEDVTNYLLSATDALIASGAITEIQKPRR